MQVPDLYEHNNGTCITTAHKKLAKKEELTYKRPLKENTV